MKNHLQAMKNAVKSEFSILRAHALPAHLVQAVEGAEHGIARAVSRFEADVAYADVQCDIGEIKQTLSELRERVHHLAVHNGLATHDVETRLSKVERDASSNRVDTGVAPAEQGR